MDVYCQQMFPCKGNYLRNTAETHVSFSFYGQLFSAKQENISCTAKNVWVEYGRLIEVLTLTFSTFCNNC